MAEKERKERNPSLYIGISVASLLLLGGVFALGFAGGKNDFKLQTGSLNKILGSQSDDSQPTPTSYIKAAVQENVENFKERILEKSIQIQEITSKRFEEEVKNMSEAQVENIKYSICEKWGIIQASPSPEVSKEE